MSSLYKNDPVEKINSQNDQEEKITSTEDETPSVTGEIKMPEVKKSEAAIIVKKKAKPAEAASQVKFDDKNVKIPADLHDRLKKYAVLNYRETGLNLAQLAALAIKEKLDKLERKGS